MHDKFITATGLVCLADSAALLWLHAPYTQDPASAQVVRVASLAAATSSLLVLPAAADALRRLAASVRKRLHRRQPEEPNTPAAPAAPTGDSAPQEGAARTPVLPVLAVPHVGRSARASVLAFAQQHNLRPFEDERGFVLADRQGQCYRAAVG